MMRVAFLVVFLSGCSEDTARPRDTDAAPIDAMIDAKVDAGPRPPQCASQTDCGSMQFCCMVCGPFVCDPSTFCSAPIPNNVHCKSVCDPMSAAPCKRVDGSAGTCQEYLVVGQPHWFCM